MKISHKGQFWGENQLYITPHTSMAFLVKKIFLMQFKVFGEDTSRVKNLINYQMLI